MEPFYRATLTLERVEPYINKCDNTDEHAIEIAGIIVTGDTPADAMHQITEHAEKLYDWHDDRTDRALLDEAGDFFNTVNDALAEAQAAEAAQDKQFVACKAPDPSHPNHFCKRPIGHEPDCDYVPVEDLPASADDEGDEDLPPIEKDPVAIRLGIVDPPAEVPERAQGGISADPVALAREVGRRASAAADAAAQHQRQRHPIFGQQ